MGNEYTLILSKKKKNQNYKQYDLKMTGGNVIILIMVATR